MHSLRCAVQNYAWGKRGSSSKVAQLKTLSGGKVEEDAPYAEYWFGTHPNGPSSVVAGDTATPLKDWLKEHPAVAGPACDGDGSLPFLFKVLSVGKALSIQAHPNKTHAAELHAARPDVYKDANHKPEMACALTKFEAMCGFRAPGEIAGFLKTVPELRAMVGETAAAAFEKAAAEADESKGDDSSAAATASSTPSAVKEALQALFTALMTCDPKEHSAAFAKRLAAEAGEAGEAALEAPHNVALRLTQQYPGDVGVVAPYLLNTVTLEPGQGLFLAANEPHAYLSGDCVEVMACSDNVVRAGLTPKLRDVPTLCKMLTYNAGPPCILAGEPKGEFVRQYTCPVPEFVLQRVAVPPGGSVELPAPASAAVLLVLEGSAGATVRTAGGAGEALSVEAGAVLLEDARATTTLEVAADASAPLLFYRVHTNGEYAE